jgi:serine/threonine-protein kinase
MVTGWLRAIEPLRYRDLARMQEPPFASLPFGAAGVAYTLLRAGRALEDRGLLERGEVWAAAAARHASSPRGFALPGGEPQDGDASLSYGPCGIRYVRVLLAHARGDAACTRLRVGAFARSSAATGARSTEFLFGTAGHLAAALVLYETTGDPRLRAVADRHARSLLGPPGARSAPAWTRADRTAFAHGQAGVSYALLRWSALTGARLPAWFFAALERLAAASTASRDRSSTGQRSAVLARAWCNGAAGMTLLWVAAFEHTGDARYRRAARTDARMSRTRPTEAGGDLCCGLAGRAYAMLAMDRAWPREGFRDHARALAAGACAQMRGRWPNGLLKGYPGLVCLAVDLLHERKPRGFPLVEA